MMHFVNVFAYRRLLKWEGPGRVHGRGDEQVKLSFKEMQWKAKMGRASLLEEGYKKIWLVLSKYNIF